MTSIESPSGGGHPPPVRAFHVTVVTLMLATVALHLYHGDGAALVRRITVGVGWQNMRPLT